MTDKDIQKSETGHIAKGTYIAGFLLSLGLTIGAYLLVWRHVRSHHTVFTDEFLNVAVAVLALTQLLVQLVFFLHLSRESKPRWNLVVLSFAALVVLILVSGSLWIMWSLNYHHAHQMNPAQTDTYIIHDEGIHH